MDQHQYYHINKKPNLKIINSNKKSNNFQNISQLFLSIKKRKSQIQTELKLQQPFLNNRQFKRQINPLKNQQQKSQDDNVDISQQMLARGNAKSQYMSYEENDSNRYLCIPLALKERMDQQKPIKASISEGRPEKDLTMSTINRLKERMSLNLQSKHTSDLQYLDQHNFLNLQNHKKLSFQTQNSQFQPVISSFKYQNSGNQSLRKDYLAKINEQKLPYINNKKSRPSPFARYKTQTSSNNHHIQNTDLNEQIVKRFVQLVKDLKRASKTNQKIQQIVKTLQQFNPFFRKIQRVIGVSLLRIGTIQIKHVGNILYQIDQTYDHFYIILYGQVKLIGRNDFCKTCTTGQTILEQILQKQKSKPLKSESIENAKISAQTWLLHIKKQDFEDLEGQLLKYGFGKGLQQLRAIVKRNSVVKKFLRMKLKSVIK